MITSTACRLSAALLVGILLSCNQVEEPSVTMRLTFEPGQTNTFQVSYIGESILEDSTGVLWHRDIAIDLQLDEACVELINDTIGRWRQASDYSIRRIDLLTGDTTHTEIAGPMLDFDYAPNGMLVDIQYAPEDTGSTLELESMREQIEQSWPVFPSRELRVGDTWSQTKTVAIGSEPHEARTTFEVMSIGNHDGRDCIILKYAGTLILPVLPDTTADLVVRGVTTVATSGTYYFDYVNGVLVRQTEYRELVSERERLDPDGVWRPATLIGSFHVEMDQVVAATDS